MYNITKSSNFWFVFILAFAGRWARWRWTSVDRKCRTITVTWARRTTTITSKISTSTSTVGAVLLITRTMTAAALSGRSANRRLPGPRPSSPKTTGDYGSGRTRTETTWAVQITRQGLRSGRLAVRSNSNNSSRIPPRRSLTELAPPPRARTPLVAVGGCSVAAQCPRQSGSMTRTKMTPRTDERNPPASCRPYNVYVHTILYSENLPSAVLAYRIYIYIYIYL